MNSTSIPQTGAQVRRLCRLGEWTMHTAGVAPGFVQANLVIVPRDSRQQPVGGAGPGVLDLNRVGLRSSEGRAADPRRRGDHEKEPDPTDGRLRHAHDHTLFQDSFQLPDSSYQSRLNIDRWFTKNWQLETGN